MTGELFADLADRLREAHRRVAALNLGHEQKACAVRRLLVITDLAKRDLDRASQRLDTFLRELRSGAGNGVREPE